MACRQSPAPGAECRVGKCPSSAPLWRAPAYSEPPLPRYPPLLLLLLWATLPPQLTSAAAQRRPQLLHVSPPVKNKSKHKTFVSILAACAAHCKSHAHVLHPQEHRHTPTLALFAALYIGMEPRSFMARVCCDSVKGTGRKGRASSDAPAAVDQKR